LGAFCSEVMSGGNTNEDRIISIMQRQHASCALFGINCACVTQAICEPRGRFCVCVTLCQRGGNSHAQQLEFLGVRNMVTARCGRCVSALHRRSALPFATPIPK